MDTPRDFAKSFKFFMDQMATQTPVTEPAVLRRLREHLAADPSQLSIVKHEFEACDHPNLQLALDVWVHQPGRSMEAFGISNPMGSYMRAGLDQCIAPAGFRGVEPSVGPVQYKNVNVGIDQVMSCLQSAIALLRAPAPLVAMIQGSHEHSIKGGVSIEVMATDRLAATGFIDEIRHSIRSRNVYRGKIISLGLDKRNQLTVEFHRLPAVHRDSIILPGGTLDRIERHTIGFSQKQAALLAAGRHLKRGLLLYGPPGTGKTFTATYLASQMIGRTVLLVTGRGQGLIESTCEMARALQPATVILEDVDLIGTARDQRSMGCATPLLFELMNQMDGLGEDADVLFILTTNRPDILEPALAARPGRVDQAIEVPLPDASCRRRLFELYAKGLTLQSVDVESVVKRTRGASAAFMKELLRRAALFAEDLGSGVVVTNRELDEAIHELTIRGGGLTRSLLGFREPADDTDE